MTEYSKEKFRLLKEAFDEVLKDTRIYPSCLIDEVIKRFDHKLIEANLKEKDTDKEAEHSGSE